VKILDFGLAKLVSEHMAVEGLTADGAAIGTPQYMPPEQWRDTKSADIRADIYSLGCSLFCLLTGRPPFVKESQTEYMAAHVLEAPPPVESLRPEVPAELASLVARMLAKEPVQRPQTPKEVAADLVPFIKAGATKSVPPAGSPPKPEPSQVLTPKAVTTAQSALKPTPSPPYTPDRAFVPLLPVAADFPGFAGFWKRFAALLIDWIATLIPTFIIGFAFGLVMAVGDASQDVIEFMGNCLGIVVWWLYCASMESSQLQGTLGKLALGIKVTDEKGDRIGFARATGRHFGKFLSALILGVGFLMVAFTPRKQTLHDSLASCLVVNRAA
jgi:uncharacterized RDD family membrane protein YckC